MKTCVFSGYSSAKAGEIKNLLEANGIPCYTKVVDRQSRSLGISAVRSRGGSFGMNRPYETLYQVLVKSKYLHTAKGLISRCE